MRRAWVGKRLNLYYSKFTHAPHAKFPLSLPLPRLPPLDRHAAVRRRRTHGGAAGAEGRVELAPADPALNRHREVDIQCPIYRTGLEVRRVGRRNDEMYSSVRRPKVEPSADPAVAG